MFLESPLNEDKLHTILKSHDSQQTGQIDYELFFSAKKFINKVSRQNKMFSEKKSEIASTCSLLSHKLNVFNKFLVMVLDQYVPTSKYYVYVFCIKQGILTTFASEIMFLTRNIFCVCVCCETTPTKALIAILVLLTKCASSCYILYGFQ